MQVMRLCETRETYTSASSPQELCVQQGPCHPRNPIPSICYYICIEKLNRYRGMARTFRLRRGDGATGSLPSAEIYASAAINAISTDRSNAYCMYGCYPKIRLSLIGTTL